MISVKGYFENAGFLTKILLFVSVILVFGVLAVFIAGISTNGDMTSLRNIRLMQIVESIGVFVLPPVVLAVFFSKTPYAYLGLNKSVQWRSLLFSVAITLFIIPFINLLTYYNQQMSLPESLKSVEDWMRTAEANAGRVTRQILFVHGYPALMFNLFLVAMLPAVGEELFFRGMLQKIFYEKFHPIVAIWLTAFIFSAFHFQFFGFIPRLLLGALLGYVYWWTKNLWYPVIIHFLNNAMAVVFYYLQFNGYAVFDIDKIGGENQSWLGVLSAAVCLFLIFLFYKYSSSEKK